MTRKVFQTAIIGAALLTAIAGGASGQDSTPTAPQTAPPEATYPEVVVQPTEQLPQGQGGGGISWFSDAIRSDSTRVGSYDQPAWTTQRLFTTSRAYVLPAGQAQFEQWVRPTWKKGGGHDYRFEEELSIGLPGRFQIDLYERWNVEQNAEDNVYYANHEGVQIEGRYAFANWGEIPFNPTLYLEWVERGGFQEKGDKFEMKLLLAEELSDRFYYASNVIWEQEVGKEHETEIGWSNAISTPLIPRKLLVGLETYWAGFTTTGHRADPSMQFQIGPSLQWQPTNRTFIDVVGLFGATHDSPTARMFIVFGYQFGTRAGPSEISGPASTRGN